VKLAQFIECGTEGLGIAVDNGLVDLRDRLPSKIITMVDLIQHWDALGTEIQSFSTLDPDLAMEQVTLKPPISRPGKIMCIGLNYADHAAETKMELPKDQLWFSKAITTVSDPFGIVQLPRVSEQLDYEAELVFVIGKRCRHVSRSEASGVIFGYFVGNDVSVRDWQLKTSQFVLGKSFDTHAPIGPWIVTADSIDPHNLGIRCSVNGEERQRSNTRHFIFDCYAMVEHLSKVMTLEPGDIVFTGTPSGVAAARTPQVWLKDGDRVRTEIEGIGYIENTIEREP
jgi:2-keto-4-pentenoate hydratase/2-oxohepta-3-ene-1,7-dioic acid hydratase in catechol pathway